MSRLPAGIRAFVAVRIPPAILSRLRDAQQQLKPDFDGVSWTRPEAMHLTLHFFGNIAAENLDGITSKLDEVARGCRPFQLTVRGLGSFSNRVIWAGLEGDTAVLNALADKVKAAVALSGTHSEDRPFNAHVTLGRLRQPGKAISSRLRNVNQENFGSWTVDHFELIRSELSPHGSRYTTLGEYRLAPPVAT